MKVAIKKYVSFNNLSKFLDNIKNIFATKTEVSAKADKSHTHSISNITSLQAALDDKAASSHGTHVTYSATAPLMDGTATVGTASTVARSDHRHPTDTSRAAQTSLDSHTGNTTYHITSTERSNWNTAYSHSQTAHAPSNAEANQNAFSNVKVGDVTIAADIKTDTLTLVAGNNITLTPDATNDKITISAKDSTYTLGSFGITATATELNKLDGVTATVTEINYVDGVTSNIQTQLDGKAASGHTHNYAGSSSVGGAATSADKVNNSLTVKLNGGTTEGTNLFTFNGSAAKSMNITPSAIGASASGHTHDDRYYTETEVDTKLSEKANSSHGNHVPPTQTANNATFLRNDNTWQKVTPANIGAASSSHTHQVSNISDLTATATELNYMDGVTSNVQAQLDGKAASGHTHSYAGSSSSGGAATSANKLNTDAGSTTQPVYFSNGVPKATTYTLGKSVPSNAVFTDTHYASKNVVGATNATSNTATALTNGNVYLNSVENGAVTSSHKISGSGATTVTTDTSGNIIISSTDNNTTYDAAGSSLGLVKSGGDVTISSGVITVNDDSHSHIISNIDNLQASLDAKQATITGGASTIASSNLTVNRALLSNGSGKVAVSDITSTELGYLDGVTSNIQTQLEGKSNTSHTHSYAGSSSVGGSATSAVKLDTATAGDSNTPVYFSGGKPVACTSLDLNTTGSAAKLTTERSIALGNDLTGSANFDGSGNITISAKHYNVAINSGNKSNYPYHRFAYRGSKASPITSQYNDTDAIFHIREAYNGGGYGIIKVSLRTNASTSVSQASAIWLARHNFALDDVKIGLYNVAGATYADLYIKVGTYARTTVIQLEGNRSWTLVDSNEVNDTTTSDKLTSTECYASIEDAATALHGQAYSSIISSVDGGTVNYANSAGSATTASACTGNSATATKLSSAKTISLTGDVTGSTSFDGSGNVSITATVADDSHNHIISNVDGLQSALDGKSATSHNHNSAYISKNLQITGDNGGAIISYNRDDGKNILTEIEALPAGFYTIYSQSGTSGNPKATEAWRFMVHKTGVTAGWVQGYGSIGSVYTNYIDGTNGWRGWRCIWDVSTAPLWSGQYYMSSPNSTPQTVTPSKKLSECRTGWLLLWSDYDPGSGSNDADFATTIIPKGTPSGGKWGGKSFLCDIPRFVGSNTDDVDTERRIIKPIYVHDDRIEGSYQNDKDERNDVVLRAVYEI